LNTTKRARQTASAVFCFAIASDRATIDPTAHLHAALKRQDKVKHRAAITTPKELSALLVDINNYSGTIITRTALQLSALFFCRPVDIRFLKWADINRELNRIEITASKTYLDHIIPLSKQATALLDNLERVTGHTPYIFPSTGNKNPTLSENTVNNALKRMGYKDKMTAHGFRATGRTILDEVLNYKIEWIEQQLAHSVKDFNGRAYNRTKHIEQRTEMMQRWADYLDELLAQATAKNVVTGNFKKANHQP
jgi:integrase